MLPTNSNKAKARGCKPVSSSCVVWQGPHIDCIDICKGDTVDEVIAKLAAELCIIVEQFDLENYDLSCLMLNDTNRPDNLQELIQLLTDRICALEGIDPGDGGTGGTGTDCPTDCIVSIAPCFQFIDPIGDTVTTLPLIDYVTAIGNQICDILDEITIINNQIDTIFDQLNNTETVLQDIQERKVDENKLQYQVNVRTDGIGDIVFITDALRIVENQSIDNKEALGTKEKVFEAVLKQGNVGDEPKLSNPSCDLKSITGFIDNPSTAADSIGNLWLTVLDLRESVEYIQDNCCSTGCADINLNLTATLLVNISSSYLTIYTTGSTGFTDSWKERDGSTLVTITDSKGGSVTTKVPLISIIDNPAGFQIDLTSTPVDTALDLTVTADTAFINVDTDTTCEKEYDYVIINTISDPVPILTVTFNSVTYQFASTPNFTYIVNVYYAGAGSPVASQIVSDPPIVVLNTITGLISDTDYELEITAVNSLGEQSVGARVPFTTLSTPCPPPTGASAIITI